MEPAAARIEVSVLLDPAAPGLGRHAAVIPVSGIAAHEAVAPGEAPPGAGGCRCRLVLRAAPPPAPVIPWVWRRPADELPPAPRELFVAESAGAIDSLLALAARSDRPVSVADFGRVHTGKAVSLLRVVRFPPRSRRQPPR